MNVRFCVLLSGFGLLMGIATIYAIPSYAEPLFWLGIFIITAYVVARYAPGKYFLHGFLISLLNSIWVTLAHISRFYDYIASHPEYMQMIQSLPPALAEHPRRMMLVTGPIIGVITGLVVGLFCWLASKFVKPTPID